MRDPARYRRAAAAVCLVLAGVLCAGFMLLAPAPGWGSDDVERLEAVADAGAPATVSFLLYAAYQLPLVIGLLGVAHLLRGSAPALSNLGATAAVVSGFGYAIYGGAQLVMPAMVADRANLELYAQLRADTEPLVASFAMLGMLGFVLAVLLLSIALWRSQTGPRTVPPVLWAFLLVEFVGTSVVSWAVYISAALLLTALTLLAVGVWRSPASAWSSGADARGTAEAKDDRTALGAGAAGETGAPGAAR